MSPDLSLVIVTVAPGTTADELSMTIPVRLPVMIWASSAAAPKRSNAKLRPANLGRMD